MATETVKLSTERLAYPDAPMTPLPEKALIHSFANVSGNSEGRLSALCERFLEISHEESLWQLLFQRDFPEKPVASTPTVHEQYAKCYLTEERWQNGVYRYQRFQTGHWPDVLCVTEQRLFCSDGMDSIQIWDIPTGTCLHTLREFAGRDLPPTYIDDKDLLVLYASYGCAGGFKVWEKNTGTFLWAQDGCTWRLVIDGDRLHGVFSEKRWSSEIQAEVEVLDRIKVWDKRDGSVILSIDERLIAHETLHVDDTSIFGVTEDGFIKFWDKNTGALLRQIATDEEGGTPYFSLYGRFSVDGHHIIYKYKNGNVKCWDKRDGSLVPADAFLGSDSLDSRKYSDEHRHFFLTRHHDLEIWDKREKVLLFVIKDVHSFEVEKERLFIAYNTGFIDICDFTSDIPADLPLEGKLTRVPASPLQQQRWNEGSYHYQRFPISGVDLSSVTEHPLVLGVVDEGIHIWEMSTARLLHTLRGFSSHELQGGYYDENLVIHTANAGGPGVDLKVWDKNSGAYLWGQDNCSWQTITLDGDRLIVCSQGKGAEWRENGPIQVRNKHNGSLILQIDENHINPITFRVNHEHILAVTTDGFIKFWDKQSGALVRQFSTNTEAPILNFSVQDPYIVCQYNNGKIKRWAMRQEFRDAVFEFPEGDPNAMGNLIVNKQRIIARQNEGVRMWDIKTQAHYQLSFESCDWLCSLDEERFLVRGTRGTEVRDTSSGGLLFSLGEDRHVIFGAKTDDFRLFCLTSNRDLQIWDKRKGELLFVINGVVSFKVEKNRLFLSYGTHFDICDFSGEASAAFPLDGRLTRL